MGKTSADANVIDLEAFRQRKLMREAPRAEHAMSVAAQPMMMPVWFCWVPVWYGATAHGGYVAP